jgi:hypothetical protein
MKHIRSCAFYSMLMWCAVSYLPAATIDFESQANGRAGDLTGIADSPVMVGIATVMGGELLKAEIGLNADQGGVYATEGLFGSSETNPVIITFSAPVSNFSVLIANGDDVRSYTVSDNRGDKAAMSLASAGSAGAGTFSLAGAGITQVMISSANADAWDFAIDNVMFSEATATPEPTSLVLVCGGLVALAASWRKLRARSLA